MKYKKISFNFYGWDIFEKEKGYNLFIGFDNSKIIGCYITLDSLDKENSSNFLYNSCLNIVKKLFFKKGILVVQFIVKLEYSVKFF